MGCTTNPGSRRLYKTNGTLTMLEASYGWDNEGKMTSAAYPNGGKTYTHTYDTMARPVKLRDNTGPRRTTTPRRGATIACCS